MPRIKRGWAEAKRILHPALVEQLARELKGDRKFGQPRIDELEYPTKAIRANVIWDEWERILDHERSDVILQAYEKAEGSAYRERITLAIGLTFPEARESGLLPYRIDPALRPGDQVALEQCYEAMRALGASELFDPGRPELWLATREEAEAYRGRLAQELPSSKDVWLIHKDFSPKDEPFQDS